MIYLYHERRKLNLSKIHFKFSNFEYLPVTAAHKEDVKKQEEKGEENHFKEIIVFFFRSFVLYGACNGSREQEALWSYSQSETNNLSNRNVYFIFFRVKT